MRLPWLREQSGRRPARFAGLAEYVLGQLLDDAPMSVSQASGTGLLDLRTLDWDAEACALAGVRPGELPRAGPAGLARAGCGPEYARAVAGAARRPGGRRRSATGPPPTSAPAASTPAGRRSPSGTSAAVRLVQRIPAGAPLPPLPDRLWRYRVDHEHVVTGAAYSGGGNLFAWAERELRLPEGAELDAALARMPPGGGASGGSPARR